MDDADLLILVFALFATAMTSLFLGQEAVRQSVLHDCLNKRELVVEMADTRFVFKCEKVTP